MIYLKKRWNVIYTVKIKETLMDELVIDAANPNEAIEKAMKLYTEGDLLPTSEKYMDVPPKVC